MNKHVIITASDAKYGDFLINHWLKSLKSNVKLNWIDVVVLDYGLKENQVEELKLEKVIVLKCQRDGHIAVIRFRDMARFLKGKDYDQVLAIDSADIIFQSDISPLFEKDKDDFRIAVMEKELMFVEIYSLGNFKKKDLEKIKKTLRKKNTLNAGVIFAPTSKFITLCERCFKLIANKFNYGPDQIAISYLLYEEGFKRLDKKDNFLIGASKDKIIIRDGIFYLQNGEKINIVHNGGRDDIFRPIINFGYGKGYNKINYGSYFGSRVIYRIAEVLKTIGEGKIKIKTMTD